MGCDIDYCLDYDLWNLSASDFLNELSKRTGEEIFLTGYKDSPYANNQIPAEGWILECFSDDLETVWKDIHSAKSVCDLELRLIKKNVSLSIYFYNKTIQFFVNSNNGFNSDERWYNWLDDYFDKKDEETISMTKDFLQFVNSELVPVFRGKQLLVCGSYPDYPSSKELINNSISEFLINDSDWSEIRQNLKKNVGNNDFIGNGNYFVYDFSTTS